MSKVSNKSIYREAITTYGEIPQIDVAIEEMAELTQALSKYKRGKQHNVEEEIADVSIMLEQLKIIFNNKKVKKIRRNKIARLNKGLKKSNSVKFIGKKGSK